MFDTAPQSPFQIESHQIKSMEVESNHLEQSEPQVESFKVFFHLVSQDQKDLETHLVDAEKSLTLEECNTILSEKLKKALNNPQYRLTPTG